VNEDQNQNRIQALLSHAFAGCLATSGALLTVWRGSLSAERAAQLVELESRGLRLGIAIAMPADRYVVQVVLTDAAGQTQVLDTIEQGGPLPCVN
jgi:hypothetical protein